MSDRPQEILRENLVECLKISDRTLVTSVFVLFVGAVTALNASEANTAVLPIGNITLKSLNTALWLILGIHFVNALRHMFLLMRAAAIAKRLDQQLLEATRFFPAVATNNVVAEATAGTLMGVLTLPIVQHILPGNYWMWVAVFACITLPFVVGNVVTIRYLNA